MWYRACWLTGGDVYRSVVGHALQSSWWPSILSTDSAATRGVPWKIVIITWSTTIIALIVSVASIVTPLGLYQTVIANDNPTPSEFHYIADKGVFHYGTPPRDNLQFSRLCGWSDPKPCPNSFTNITFFGNETGDYYDVHNYDSSIPQYVMDVFQSGLKTMNKSVSSIFDIQPRYYSWSEINDYKTAMQPDNGSTHPVSSFRQLGSLLMENDYVLIEGLVVDMKKGGIGFRNHSAPPVRPYGSTWSEELLFIEPESHCVDLNLTLDFMLPKYTSQGWQIHDLVLTDRGGFVNLNKTYPKWDFNSDRQKFPQLEARAYKAAWLNNAYTMVFMNVTNVRNQSDPNSEPFSYLKSEMGKRFPLMYNDSTGSSPMTDTVPSRITTSSMFGYYLNGLDMEIESYNTSSLRDPGNGTITPPGKPPLYPNPFGIDLSLWSSIGKFSLSLSPQSSLSVRSNYLDRDRL